MNGNSNTRVIW